MATAEAPVFRCTVCHAVYTNGERFCPLDAAPIAAEDRHTDPRVGKTIDGRYFVRRLIGRGGMGAVYEADHVGLDKRVAIKFLSTALTDRDSLARFRREAKVAGKIDHVHVVRIFDVGSADADSDYIVMELIEGKDLGAVLRDGGSLDPARTTSIIRKVLRGLRAIHAAGIVHRDIKPANILLSHGGEGDEDHDFVKIMDFGISKSMNNSDALTNTGAIIGTPEYMAPEQLLGDAVDQRADLYAVGLMAFRMLTGTLPFTTDKGFERGAAANPYVEVPAIHSLRPDVPLELSEVLAKALAKEPEQRYLDAAAFLAALETVGPVSSVTAVPPAAPRSSTTAVPATRTPITGTEQTMQAAAVAVADTAIAPASVVKVNPANPAAVAPTVASVPRRSGRLWLAIVALLVVAGGAVAFVLVTRGDDRDPSTDDRQVAEAHPPAPPPKAQGNPPPTTSPAPKDKPKDKGRDRQDKVAGLKQKARAAEAAGKRDEAVQAYLDAYTFDPDPALLYSIAENYEAMPGRTQDAIRYFKRYLHEGNPHDRADIEKRIKQLEDWLAAELVRMHGSGSGSAHTGGAAPPSRAHALKPVSKKTCHCIANYRARRNSMSLCKQAQPLKCRCQSSGRKLCKTELDADGKCPGGAESYHTSATPETPCQGWETSGEIGKLSDGTWECHACPSSKLPFHGEDGDACSGYYLDNGQLETKAELMGCS